MILTDHIFQGPINQVIRIAKTAIENLKNKGGIERVPSGISLICHDGFTLHSSNEAYDFMHLCIVLALKLSHRNP